MPVRLSNPGWSYWFNLISIFNVQNYCPNSTGRRVYRAGLEDQTLQVDLRKFFLQGSEQTVLFKIQLLVDKAVSNPDFQFFVPQCEYLRMVHELRVTNSSPGCNQLVTTLNLSHSPTGNYSINKSLNLLRDRSKHLPMFHQVRR